MDDTKFFCPQIALYPSGLRVLGGLIEDVIIETSIKNIRASTLLIRSARVVYYFIIAGGSCYIFCHFFLTLETLGLTTKGSFRLTCLTFIMYILSLSSCLVVYKKKSILT